MTYLAECLGVFAKRMNSRVVRMPGKEGRERLVRFGFEGCADILGWVDHCRYPAGEPFDTHSNPIACDGTGMYHVPRFLAIECKRPGEEPSPAQAAFLEQVRQAGGLAIVATSVADVRKALGR